jgi:hypothetical protein
MNVLVIPEDFRKDQFVVKPIVRRIFKAVGKSNANVRVCLDPLLGGVGEALKWRRIEDILDRYRGDVNIFLLLVDRDGEEGRRQALDKLEEKAGALLGGGKLFLAENAWQEMEVWALAGQVLPKGWNWQAIRAELHPKETYFEPLANQRGLTDEPGEGRTTMGREAAANYSRVRSRCKEDIQVLESRLKAWLGAS